MGNLLIFLDETGTMPLNDRNTVFAATGIGVFDNYPIFVGQQGHKPWLIGQIVKHSAIPFISYIDPDDDFFTKINSKLDDVEKMAFATLEKTGNNEKYITPFGMEKRNFLWIQVVVNCIGQIILNATIRNSIDTLTIYLDQKSLKPTSLNLFKNQIEGELELVKNSLKRIDNVPKIILEIINSKLNWDKDKIRIIWSDEPEALPAIYGLEVAHYLGYFFRKDYKKNNSEGNLLNRLSKAGYIYYSNKMNSVLTREINTKSVQDWESNTGFKLEHLNV